MTPDAALAALSAAYTVIGGVLVVRGREEGFFRQFGRWRAVVAIIVGALWPAVVVALGLVALHRWLGEREVA